MHVQGEQSLKHISTIAAELLQFGLPRLNKRPSSTLHPLFTRRLHSQSRPPSPASQSRPPSPATQSDCRLVSLNKNIRDFTHFNNKYKTDGTLYIIHIMHNVPIIHYTYNVPLYIIHRSKRDSFKSDRHSSSECKAAV